MECWNLKKKEKIEQYVIEHIKSIIVLVLGITFFIITCIILFKSLNIFIFKPGNTLISKYAEIAANDQIASNAAEKYNGLLQQLNRSSLVVGITGTIASITGLFASIYSIYTTFQDKKRFEEEKHQMEDTKKSLSQLSVTMEKMDSLVNEINRQNIENSQMLCLLLSSRESNGLPLKNSWSGRDKAKEKDKYDNPVSVVDSSGKNNGNENKNNENNGNGIEDNDNENA